MRKPTCISTLSLDLMGWAQAEPKRRAPCGDWGWGVVEVQNLRMCESLRFLLFIWLFLVIDTSGISCSSQSGRNGNSRRFDQKLTMCLFMNSPFYFQKTTNQPCVQMQTAHAHIDLGDEAGVAQPSLPSLLCFPQMGHPPCPPPPAQPPEPNTPPCRIPPPRSGGAWSGVAGAELEVVVHDAPLVLVPPPGADGNTRRGRGKVSGRVRGNFPTSKNQVCLNDEAAEMRKIGVQPPPPRTLSSTMSTMSQAFASRWGGPA